MKSSKIKDIKVVLDSEFGVSEVKPQEDNYIHIVMDNKVYSKFVEGVGNIKGEKVKLEVMVHQGMFQDSVLITDLLNYTYDFRYFIGINNIKIYRFNGNIARVIVENVGEDEIYIWLSDKKIMCNAGEKITLVEQ